VPPVDVLPPAALDAPPVALVLLFAVVPPVAPVEPPVLLFVVEPPVAFGAPPVALVEPPVVPGNPPVPVLAVVPPVANGAPPVALVAPFAVEPPVEGTPPTAEAPPPAGAPPEDAPPDVAPCVDPPVPLPPALVAQPGSPSLHVTEDASCDEQPAKYNKDERQAVRRTGVNFMGTPGRRWLGVVELPYRTPYHSMRYAYVH